MSERTNEPRTTTYRNIYVECCFAVPDREYDAMKAALTPDAILASARALSGVRNPEAVKRLIEAVREWAQTNPMTGKQRVPLENAIHAAFRELEMETKP